MSFISEKYKRILLCNPRCGNSALVRAWKMEPLTKDPHAVPAVVRKKLGKAAWDEYAKVIVLRDPRDRAISALAAGLPLPPPQAQWLTCRYDLILGQRYMAEYFNHSQEACIRVMNASGDRRRGILYSTNDAKEDYAQDYALLEKVGVWRHYGACSVLDGHK